MTDELPVILHAYDLLVWTLRHVEKFPRAHRHALGLRLETKLYDLLDLLIAARYTRDRQDILQQAGFVVEQTRFLLRAVQELRLMSLSSHRHACERLDEIGREVGGWRKQGRES